MNRIPAPRSWSLWDRLCYWATGIFLSPAQQWQIEAIALAQVENALTERAAIYLFNEARAAGKHNTYWQDIPESERARWRGKARGAVRQVMQP